MRLDKRYIATLSPYKQSLLDHLQDLFDELGDVQRMQEQLGYWNKKEDEMVVKINKLSEHLNDTLTNEEWESIYGRPKKNKYCSQSENIR